jgi:hypothetical protein
MPTSSRAAKMKLKPGAQAALLAAPEGYLKELSPLPAGASITSNGKGKFDWIQVFVKSRKELEKLAPRAIRALKSESILWISFPKGTSGIQTDLTRDEGWDILKKSDLKWITLISVNETWSAFALRPYKSGEVKQSFR